jgi:hypothetical protein
MKMKLEISDLARTWWSSICVQALQHHIAPESDVNSTESSKADELKEKRLKYNQQMRIYTLGSC